MSNALIFKRKAKPKNLIGNDVLSRFDSSVLSAVFDIRHKGMQVGDILFSVKVPDAYLLFATVCPTEYRTHEQAEHAKAAWLFYLSENPSDDETLDLSEIDAFNRSNVPLLVGSSVDGAHFNFMHRNTLRVYGMDYNSNKLKHFSITPTELAQAKV